MSEQKETPDPRTERLLLSVTQATPYGVTVKLDAWELFRFQAFAHEEKKRWSDALALAKASGYKVAETIGTLVAAEDLVRKLDHACDEVIQAQDVYNKQRKEAQG